MEGRGISPSFMLRVIGWLGFAAAAPDETAHATTAVHEQMRRIGINRFLFGSDFNVQTPMQEMKDIEKLNLTTKELETLQQNCAPWACSDSKIDDWKEDSLPGHACGNDRRS